MPTYVGWVPTALGRLSFSRIGDRYEAKCSAINTTGSDDFGALFGVQRVRATLWRFEWLSRFWGKHATTDLAFFLETAPCVLPYPAEAESDNQASVRLNETLDGCLSGEVFILNEWNFFQGRPAFAALDTVRDATLSGRSAANLGAIRTLRDKTRNKVASTWRLMRQRVDRRKSTPRFGKAEVQLLRTGECRVTVELEDLSDYRDMKAFGVLSRMDQDFRKRYESVILEEAASNVFLGLRNLAHKHYHHDPEESIHRPVTILKGDDDYLWRRRTLEGLMRMCVAQRRKENSKSYRRALGVLAYTDAFHRHIAGWCLEKGVVVSTPNKAEYDFGALKNSIEASLKERELRDQNVRARIFFTFGILITALTILLPTYRSRIEAAALNEPLTRFPTGIGPDAFAWTVKLVLDHPLTSAVFAIAIGVLIDKLVTSMSVSHPIYHWNRIISQLTEGTLSLTRRVTPGARESRWLVIIMTAIGSVMLMAVWVNIAQQIEVPIEWSGN